MVWWKTWIDRKNINNYLDNYLEEKRKSGTLRNSRRSRNSEHARESKATSRAAETILGSQPHILERKPFSTLPNGSATRFTVPTSSPGADIDCQQSLPPKLSITSSHLG